MERQILNKAVQVSEEGFLTDFTQWNKDIALELAKEANLTLTDRHWAVIAFLQDQQAKGLPLTIRKVGKSGIVDIKEFYQLFPIAPLKTASKIAGIPKPVSCI